MIATRHNMVHGALRTIIIHRKNIETNGGALIHQGLVHMDIVLYMTYPNVYLQ